MILKVEKKINPYVQINNSVLEDKRLSFRAKGVLCYLLSKPNGWTVRIEDLLKKGREGNGQLRKALDELKITGYIELISKFKQDSNLFDGRYYLIREEPLFLHYFRYDKNKNKSFSKEEPLISEEEFLKPREFKHK